MITLPERLQPKTEVYRKMLEQFGAELRVASPGEIVSYDSSAQTATIQLTIREKINVDGNLSWESIPLLVDVPVIMPRGGGYMLEFQPNSGDECLVIFGDNCLDSWWQSSGIQNQIDKRRHDLSDGFAILGPTSQPKKVTSLGSGIRLRNESGTVKIEISGSTATITAANVVVGSSTTIDGKNFLSHTHGGVEPGGGTTGGVS
jgi:hypothetical protein